MKIAKVFFIIAFVIVIGTQNVWSGEYREIWKSQKFKVGIGMWKGISTVEINDLNGNKYREIFVGSWFGGGEVDFVKSRVTIYEWDSPKEKFVQIYESDNLSLDDIIGKFYYLPSLNGFLLCSEYILDGYEGGSYGFLLIWDKTKNNYQFNFKKELYRDENNRRVKIEELDEKAKVDYLFVKKIRELLEKEISKDSYANIKVRRGDTNGDGKEDVWAIITKNYQYDEGYLYNYERSSDGKSLLQRFVDKKDIFEVIITDIDNDGMDEIIEGEVIRDYSMLGYEGEGPEPVLEPTTGKLYILKWDGKIYKEIWQSEEIGGVGTIAVGDVDADGKKEIVVGDWHNHIRVFHVKDKENE